MAKTESENKEFYSIGEVSKLCNVSKKALRFYDEIGIISPDKVSPSNHYRYYSRNSLLDLTIVKYYKQMGFKLEEMRTLLNSEEYREIERGFLRKINELQDEQMAVNVKLTSVSDWYDLLVEAQTVIENDVREVSVKFIEPKEYGFMEQEYIEDDREAVINLEWTDYLHSIKNEITGAVNITFPSWRDRLNGTCKTMKIMQELLFPSKPEHQIQMGGEMMLSCYHIGSHDTIRETYEKIEQYAANHGYKLAEDSWERYVTDCWTTNNSDMYVTEVRIGASR
ncbi:MAG: MerR family transcriptional regulator [Clostridiales bacterium]|nr:MerR family transcriptional regulator [Clostridiales bacterium]MBQ3322275.1 MerR family transcriptional regulator [Bacillota bacterium]